MMFPSIFDIEPNKVSTNPSDYCNLIYGPPKVGKGHLLDDVILTDKGYEKVRNLKVGDIIFGEDGKPYHIEGYYPRGKQDFYTITFSDGAEITVSADHLWNVELVNEKSFKTFTTVELLEDNKGEGARIPMTAPVDYGQEKSLDKGLAYSMGQKEISPNNDIIFGSIRDRFSYLKGLLWNRRTNCTYQNPDVEMLKNIQMIIHSLGGSCIIKDDYIEYYLISERKIVSIVPAGNHECVCIKTTNPTELYLAKDCIVTHNTTLMSCFEKPLILAYEVGFKAIPGVMAMIIKNHSHAKTLLNELLTEQGKSKFRNIVIDTFDLFYMSVEDHVCNIHGVKALKDVGYGAGHAAVKKEMTMFLHQLTKYGYGVHLICHPKKEIIKQGEQDVIFIKPLLNNTAATIAQGFVDQIIYLQETQEGRKMFFRTGVNDNYLAGSRFSHIPKSCHLKYEEYEKALEEAVSNIGNEYRQDDLNLSAMYGDSDTLKFDFVELMKNVNETIAQLMKINPEENQLRIKTIVETELGVGAKVGEANHVQAPFVANILTSLTLLLNEQLS